MRILHRILKELLESDNFFRILYFAIQSLSETLRMLEEAYGMATMKKMQV
jgi:hypothetical protein